MAMNSSAEHHCLVSQSDEDCIASYDRCKHKDRHKEFIRVPEFRKKFLDPLCEEYTNWEKEWMDFIIACTVRVVVTYVSLLRPDRYLQQSALAYPFGDSKGKDYRRVGTGFVRDCIKISKDGESCPCPECKNSTHPKTTFWEVLVSTATHVVFDTSEAKTAKFELFYESSDRQGVKYLYGVGVYGNSYTRYLSDACPVVCVTHDEDLGNLLTGFVVTRRALEDSRQNKDSKSVMGADILVSHPHGLSKMVSVGKVDEMVQVPCSLNLFGWCLYKNEMKQIQIVHLKTENEESGITTITNTPNDNPCKDKVVDIYDTHFPPCCDQFLKHFSIDKDELYYNSERNEEEYSKVCTALDKASVEYDKQSIFFRLSDGGVAVMSLDHEVTQDEERNWEFSYLLSPGIIYMSSTGKVHHTTKEIQFRYRPDRDYNGPSMASTPRLYYSMAGCPGSSGAFVGLFGGFVHHEETHNMWYGNHFGVDGNRSFNGLFSFYRERTAPRNPAVSLMQRIRNYFKRK